MRCAPSRTRSPPPGRPRPTDRAARASGQLRLRAADSAALSLSCELARASCRRSDERLDVGLLGAHRLGRGAQRRELVVGERELDDLLDTTAADPGRDAEVDVLDPVLALQ